MKNHADFQHYDPLKRRPPWIKLHNNVLGGDDGFERLTEAEQWQLVRIWLVASKSSALTYDEAGTVVPAVVDDEHSLRRSIMSLKRIPLEKFIREGWLIPVAESDLIPPGGASAGDSAGASTEASAPLAVEEQSSRGLEKPLKAVPASEEINREIDKISRLPGHDENSWDVVASFAVKLDYPTVCRIRQSAQEGGKGVKWAVKALKGEVEERPAA